MRAPKLSRHLTVLLVGCLLIGAQPSDQVDDEEERVRVEVLDKSTDDPRVWELVNSFCESPQQVDPQPILQLLDEKLENREAYSDALVVAILNATGDQQWQEGRAHVRRFVGRAGMSPGSLLIPNAAAIALARLGGDASLDDLEEAAASRDAGIRAGIAVALGVLKNPDATEALMRLAEDAKPEVRAKAVSSLARYCAKDSRRLVLLAIRDQDPDVRASAARWVGRCGGPRDAGILLGLLDDRSGAVVFRALNGLRTLHSTAACDRLGPFLENPYADIVSAAKEYRQFCGGDQRDRP